MLVLSRHIGERIVIDNNIIVEIVDVKGDNVKIGIIAPRNVPIYRSELQHMQQHFQKPIVCSG